MKDSCVIDSIGLWRPEVLSRDDITMRHTNSAHSFYTAIVSASKNSPQSAGSATLTLDVQRTRLPFDVRVFIAAGPRSWNNLSV